MVEGGVMQAAGRAWAWVSEESRLWWHMQRFLYLASEAIQFIAPNLWLPIVQIQRVNSSVSCSFESSTWHMTHFYLRIYLQELTSTRKLTCARLFHSTNEQWEIVCNIVPSAASWSGWLWSTYAIQAPKPAEQDKSPVTPGFAFLITQACCLLTWRTHPSSINVLGGHLPKTLHSMRILHELSQKRKEKTRTIDFTV